MESNNGISRKLEIKTGFYFHNRQCLLRRTHYYEFSKYRVQTTFMIFSLILDFHILVYVILWLVLPMGDS
jgi:hypothetical protein